MLCRCGHKLRYRTMPVDSADDSGCGYGKTERVLWCDKCGEPGYVPVRTRFYWLVPTVVCQIKKRRTES